MSSRPPHPEARKGSRFAAEECALVVVDVQNDFCDPAGTIGRAGTDLTAVNRAVDAIAPLVEGAHAAGVPVVFVQTLHGGALDSDEWVHRHAEGITGHPAPPNCVEGTWGADFYRLKPRGTDLISRKHRYSAFSAPDLRGRLDALGRRSLIFTGVATNVCVESSVRSAVDNDFLASVVPDACAAFSPGAHERAITVITQHFGRAIAGADLLARWQS